MIFEGVLAEQEKKRAESVLLKLRRHDISGWALTGGFAIEIHLRQAGGEARVRRLHDLDFIVGSFESIPRSISRDFLIRHVHPRDPVGKNLLQCVDDETGVRIDVFRTHTSVMSRTLNLDCGLRIISREDLTARAGRLAWNLSEKPVAPKYVQDFLRLIRFASLREVEAVWQEQRDERSPATFTEAVEGIERLVEARSHLLVEPSYSTDIDAVCERCVGDEAFPLADARLILTILGYC